MQVSQDKAGKKIRVIHYCNQLSIGGTEKTMELFCKHLDKTRFDVFAISRIHRESFLKRAKVAVGAVFGNSAARGKKRLWASMNARTPNFQAILGGDKVLFVKSDEELRETILRLKPHVLHVHYSGNPESPTSDEAILSQVPLTITTNQFERENTAPAHRFVKRMFFVSKWMLENRAHWAAKDSRSEVFYNPVEVPCSTENLRDELQIPADAFVVGRIGRADPGIHDPISLKAFAKIANAKSYFIAVSPPENMLQQAKALGLKNFIALPPSTSDVFLSKFYNTIDVFAHARRDGETFGCVLAEAMIHGRPVISHVSAFMNAQKEVIGDAGYVCALDDWAEYATHLEKLREDTAHRKALSEKAHLRAREQFEAKNLTNRLASIYEELL